MATNFAQKLERERQSPKGNLVKNIAVGATAGGLKKVSSIVRSGVKKRMNPDTGWIETTPLKNRISSKIAEKIPSKELRAAYSRATAKYDVAPYRRYIKKN